MSSDLFFNTFFSAWKKKMSPCTFVNSKLRYWLGKQGGIVVHDFTYGFGSVFLFSRLFFSNGGYASRLEIPKFVLFFYSSSKLQKSAHSLRGNGWHDGPPFLSLIHLSSLIILTYIDRPSPSYLQGVISQT